MENHKKMPCWCQIVLSALIIVLVWWWTPDWANIAITVLAALLLLKGLAGNICCCQGGCKMPGKKEEMPKEEPMPEDKGQM